MINIRKSRTEFLVLFVVVSCSFHDHFVVLFVVIIKASARHSSLHNQGLNQPRLRINLVSEHGSRRGQGTHRVTVVQILSVFGV